MMKIRLVFGNRFKKCLTILAFSLMFCQFSMATTYYLTTTGSDSNNGTTLTTGFATFSYAIGKLVAGDILYVRKGTYTCNTRVELSKSGSSGNLITVMAYPSDIVVASDRPILNFWGMVVGSSNQGLHVTGGYWHLKGLRIRGAGDNGMLMETAAATQNVIEFCDFFENRDAGCQIRKSASNDQFINCDAFNNADMGTGTTTLGGNADGFAPKLDLGENISFTGCRSWMNSDDGWDGYLKCTEAGLPDNMTTFLTNCWAFNNGYYWLDGSTNSDMNGNGIKMGGSTNKDQAHNFVVKNCLSYNNKSKGFDQNNSAGSLTLYNCTSVKNLALDYGLNSSGVTYASNSVFKIINCVELGTTGTSFKSGATLTTNNFATVSTDYVSVDTTGLSASRKPDGSLPDITFMHPKTGSKLIDVGTDVGIPYNGTKPDLGYWETGALTNVLPTISITVPANNTSFIAPASVTLTATALDADGTIAKVDFYSGTTLLNSDNTYPYSYIWTNVDVGIYTINAIATDNSGGTTTSSTITITVIAAVFPTVTDPTNKTQSVVVTTAISPIIFTWGGTATSASVSGLPTGLTSMVNATAKTLTISGTPTASGTYTIITVGGTPAVSIQGTSTVLNVPTLIVTANSTQVVVFTWGAAATDVSYTTLPSGLTATKNTTAKTLIITGTPLVSGSYSVITIGGSPAITLNSTVTINKNVILANWYPFQEDPISLSFVTFANSTINTTFDASTYSAAGCTNGALIMTKTTGVITLTLNSITALKVRWGATGGRTIQVTYGTTGTENTWTSSNYTSGGNQVDIIGLAPAIASSSPIIVTITNSGTGSLNLTDLYVEGSIAPVTQNIALSAGWNLISFNVSPVVKTLDTVFKALIANVLEIKTADDFWRLGQNVAFNSLKEITDGFAYLVNMKVACIISVSGPIVAQTLPTIIPGWQMIGCPYQFSTAITTAFTTANILAIKNFSAFWLPAGTGTLLNIDPGKGYFVKGK